MEFNYIALIACLLLLIFLLFQEVGRSDKARLAGRIIANFIAVSCFALLLVPIKYKRTQQQNANEMILLTKGANLDSVVQLKGDKYVLASADVKNAKVKVIPELSYFLQRNPAITKLNIYGYGLDAPTLKSLDGYEISFHPAEKPSGLISASWLNQVKTTEVLNVQGTYQNTGKAAVKLLLKGFGKIVDSVVINAKATQSFSFKNRPKQIGKASYQLIALQAQDTLNIDPVPFEIIDQKPMKILILASFPDFEYKFLKKWLYENQYPLAFRSQISKAKYAFDFLNMDSLRFDRIDQPTLKKFDLLIIDEEELTAIKPQEYAAITRAVANGLGLLIRIAKLKATTPLSARFTRFEAPVTKDKQLSLVDAIDNYKFNKLPLEQILFLKSSTNDLPLMADVNGKILVNSSISGYGKIVVSAISSTYNWLLAGKNADYTSYWSNLLSQTARKKNEVQSLVISPQFPVLHQQARIVVDLPESSKAPALKIDGASLSPRQNIELPFQWDAFYWPEKTGWNDLQINGSTKSFYVYQPTDWQVVKAQQTLQDNLDFVKQTQHKQTPNAITGRTVENEVSKWWFFIGFLLAAGFLWYESRILN